MKSRAHLVRALEKPTLRQQIIAKSDKSSWSIETLSNQQSEQLSGSASGGSMNFAGFVAKLDHLEKTSDDHDEVKMVSMLSAIFVKLKD